MKTDLQKYCFGESAVTLFLVVCLLHILGTAKVVDTILAIISASSQISLKGMVTVSSYQLQLFYDDVNLPISRDYV